MKQLVYITGSGHSGSTLLDRLLGSHPDVIALGEVHRFSLGLHRNERPFGCDCGKAVPECDFWKAVIDQLAEDAGIDRDTLIATIETTDHAVLKQSSGERYFNEKAPYQFLPKDVSKYILALSPSIFLSVFEKAGMLGTHLVQARNSLDLFKASSMVSMRGTVVDSTKNPLRMRALYYSAKVPMKVIYLKRDGRAVTNSRIKRQSVSMKEAANIWVAENRKVEIVLKRMRGVDVLPVQYEDLCSATTETMAQIMNFLDLPEATLDLHSPRHAIGGNPSRFNSDKAIRLDEAWKQELDTNSLSVFDKIAGKYNNYH